MKRIGLIGGFSWLSTLEYYRLLNQFVCDKLGVNHSAELLLINLDRAIFDEYVSHENEAAAYQLIADAAKKLHAGDSELMLMCANGLHRFYDQLQLECNLPILHIADAAAVAIKKEGCKKVGLLGIRATMEGHFYKDRLNNHGIETIVPDTAESNFIHETIFSELVCGRFLPETKKRYLKVIQNLVKNGAEGVILGCTEIPLLVHQKDSEAKLFPTLELHCAAAVEAALQT